MSQATGRFFYDENDYVVRWENSYVACVSTHSEGRRLAHAMNFLLKEWETPYKLAKPRKSQLKSREGK